MSARSEISASVTPGVYGAEAGGEPFSPCCGSAARHPIAAHAADPSPAVPGRTTDPRPGQTSSHCQTGRAVGDSGAASFGWTWPPARRDLLRAEFPTCRDDAALLAALNALPGKPIAGIRAMRQQACVMGIAREDATTRYLRAQGGIRSNAIREKNGGGPKIKRTPERTALLRAEWTDCTDREALLARLNALPGLPFASVETLREWARKMAVPMWTKPVEPPPAPVVVAPPPPPPPAPKPPKARKVRLTAPPMKPKDVIAPLPAPEPPPPARLREEVTAAMADAALAAKHDKARAMLKRKTEPFIVANHTRLPLREVFRLQAEVRAAP